MKDKKQLSKLTVNVPFEIPKRNIASLLVSAIESGGIGYWCPRQDFKYIKPKGAAVPVLDEGDDKPKVRPCYDYPLLPGGAVEFKAEGKDGKRQTCRLDLQSIEKGLAVMAQKYPRHFVDIVIDNDDAVTADVFVQCCVFGELVYG